MTSPLLSRSMKMVRTTRTAVAVALLGAVAACGGDNEFRDNPFGVQQPDPNAPAAVQDTIAPSESRVVLPLPDAVVAIGDPLQVRVAVADDVALDSVSVVALGASAGAPTFDREVLRYAPSDTIRSDTALLTLRPSNGQATGAVTLVSTAFDRAGNPRSDTLRISLAAIRGEFVAIENSVDRLVDLVTDGERVFVSNFSRNRVEVLNVGTNARSSFRVGSQPWGLALSPDRSTLYVANSGGTNISVVDLRVALQENEARRIQTPNVQLFEVPFSRDSIERVINGQKTKISVQVPSGVTGYDYSDRPQFIAQTSSGDILYSTKPARAAADGTIRRRRANGSVELFLDYAAHDAPGTLIVVNADSVALIEGDPNLLFVRSKEGGRYTGVIDSVAVQLQRDGSETYFDYFRNLKDVGLRDTTFVAVSGDHGTVAFGEGAADLGRVILFRPGTNGDLLRSGNTRDLVNNAAERVIGLALNQDGTLGAARGAEAYFFTPDLRLQGVGVTGEPSGGLAFRPGHSSYPSTPSPSRLAFVSGRDENGSPYIDVLDTFSFFRRTRIFVRRAVTGPLLAVAAPSGSGAVLHLYAIAGPGVLRIDVAPADLQP